MKNASARTNPMIMVGLIVAMVLLVGAIVLSISRPVNNAKTVHLASGEWAPYVGESLPDNGVATVIVDFVFKQMGYQTQYHFMPWELAQSRAEQSQTNEQIRGVFPYIYSQQREGQFYFSDGIIDIAFGVFFHRKHNTQAADIAHHQDLKHHAVITLQGYEYADEISQYLPANTCDSVDTAQGFEALERDAVSVFISENPLSDEWISQTLTSDEAKRVGMPTLVPKLRSAAVKVADVSAQPLSTNIADLFLYWFTPEMTVHAIIDNIDAMHLIMTPQSADLVSVSSATDICIQPDARSALLYLHYRLKPKVLLEAIEVGENILTSSLPKLAPHLQLSSYSIRVPHRVMFAKNNPNNLGLRDQFNQRLKELRENRQAYDKLLQTTVTKIQMANAVTLEATANSPLVSAGVFDLQSQDCQFDNLVYFPKGSKALVRQWPSIFLTASNKQPSGYVIARILNGPLAANTDLYCFAPDAIKLQ